MLRYIFLDKFIFYGLISIVFAFINLFKSSQGKDYKVYMFLSLVFTAFTVCGFIVDASVRIHDASYLEDVNGYAHILLWFLVCCSIFLNSIPVFVEEMRNRKITKK